MSEGWSLLELGETLHWNCSWNIGSRVFLTAVFFVFLADDEGVRRTCAQYQPVSRVTASPRRRAGVASMAWRRAATI